MLKKMIENEDFSNNLKELGIECFFDNNNIQVVFCGGAFIWIKEDTVSIRSNCTGNVKTFNRELFKNFVEYDFWLHNEKLNNIDLKIVFENKKVEFSVNVKKESEMKNIPANLPYSKKALFLSDFFSLLIPHFSNKIKPNKKKPYSY